MVEFLGFPDNAFTYPLDFNGLTRVAIGTADYVDALVANWRRNANLPSGAESTRNFIDSYRTTATNGAVIFDRATLNDLTSLLNSGMAGIYTIEFVNGLSRFVTSQINPTVTKKRFNFGLGSAITRAAVDGAITLQFIGDTFPEFYDANFAGVQSVVGDMFITARISDGTDNIRQANLFVPTGTRVLEPRAAAAAAHATVGITGSAKYSVQLSTKVDLDAARYGWFVISTGTQYVNSSLELVLGTLFARGAGGVNIANILFIFLTAYGKLLALRNDVASAT